MHNFIICLHIIINKLYICTQPNFITLLNITWQFLHRNVTKINSCPIFLWNNAGFYFVGSKSDQYSAVSSTQKSGKVFHGYMSSCHFAQQSPAIMFQGRICAVRQKRLLSPATAAIRNGLNSSDLSQYEYTVLTPSTGIPMIKVRQSHDRLIFIMKIPIPWKWVFILEQVTSFCKAYWSINDDFSSNSAKYLWYSNLDGWCKMISMQITSYFFGTIQNGIIHLVSRIVPITFSWSC